MASGNGAAHDLRPALQALADTSALEQRQGAAAEAPGSREPAQQQRPRALLAVYYDRVCSRGLLYSAGYIVMQDLCCACHHSGVAVRALGEQG